MKKYKVVIIGAGTAGLTARSQIAKKTDDYLVVDNGPLGTTCARVGCMPSKVLIQVANDYHRRLTLKEEGIFGGEALDVRTEKVMSHVRKLRDRFVRGVLSGFENWKETNLSQKRATFVDQNTLDLEGEQISFEKAIIATGSAPIVPAPWKEFSNYLVTTDQFFELDSLPKRMAVIGLGVIGIELGQALHRLGVDVVCIGRGNSIAGISDPKLQEYSLDTFSKEMKIDITGVEKISEKNGKLAIKTKNGSFTADKALVAIGRSPNLANLGLENVTGHFSKRGLPEFDKTTFQLRGCENILIVGDVNGVAPILHESSDEGAIAGFILSGHDDGHCFKRRISIGITFCSPNIAFIGKNYKQLTEDNIDFEIGEVSFEGQGRAIVMLSEKGLLRLYGCKNTNKLLGAELFAPAGEHLAHLIAWAISANMTVEDILRLPFYHPVIEEGLRTALRDLAKKLNENRTPFELVSSNDHPTNYCK